jgi:hypothetical protein
LLQALRRGFLPTLLVFPPRYDVLRAGAVAEWLGKGLQSPVHRFDSGPRLSSLFAGAVHRSLMRTL